MKIEERHGSLENTPRNIARIDVKRMDAFCEDLCSFFNPLYLPQYQECSQKTYKFSEERERGGDG